MSDKYKRLEIEILEFGGKLTDPPPSAADLFRLLKNLFFNCLSHIRRSPPVSIQHALFPVKKALVDAKLFKYSDLDVKLAVAACITDIARISAPRWPYDEEQMEVRLCAVMLDLQCDELLFEMFQHFLRTISNHHQACVFPYMKKIMTLVLEESDDIPGEMLSLILRYVRLDNLVIHSFKAIPPVPRRLTEEVLSNCASNSKLKTKLTEAVNSSGVSFDKYSKIVASICEVTNSAEEKPDVEDHSMEKEPDSSKTSDIKEETEPGALMDSKDVLRLPPDDSSVNAATSSENEKKTSVQALPSKPSADETANVSVKNFRGDGEVFLNRRGILRSERELF